MTKTTLTCSLALLFAAACGEDDATTTNPATPSTTAPPAPSASAPNPAATGGGAPTTPLPAPAPAPSPAPSPALTSTQGRLLVGDGDPENPRMMVVDLDDGKVVASFPTLGTAATYRSHARSVYAYANQRVHGVVEIVDAGIVVDAGGKSLAKTAPRIVPQRFEGELPTHWVHHDDWIVSFNDGDGSFDYMLEPTLASGRVLTQRATTGKRHHGVAVIARGNVFATLPDPVDPSAQLPVGVSMRRLATPDTVVRESAECPALHGEGASDDTVAFGCGDGILIAERKDGDFAFRKLSNPPETPAGRRVGTVRLEKGLPRIIANWGNGVAIVNHTVEPATWTPVDFGAANLAFYVTEDGAHVVAIDGTGALRRYDARTGAEVGARLEVTAPWAAPALRPALGLGDGKAFIADPRSGKIVEVDLVSWTKQRTLEVGGKPASVAAFARVTL